MRRVAILGGTFDPIHLGHLAVTAAARHALELDEVLIVPSHSPPHRPSQPYASAFHRFAMVALAIVDRPDLVASDLELGSAGPSYTSRTLTRLHQRGFAASQLFFIIGADAFAEITTWHDYPAILDRCHFIVVSRPTYPVKALPDLLPFLARRMVMRSALQAPGSTERHGDVAVASETPMIFLVDATTPDVSSSSVRRRIMAGEPLAGLVPPAVQEYIRRQQLYVAESAGSPVALQSREDNLHE